LGGVERSADQDGSMRSFPAVAIVASSGLHVAAIWCNIVTVAAGLASRDAIELKHIGQVVVSDREGYALALQAVPVVGSHLDECANIRLVIRVCSVVIE